MCYAWVNRERENAEDKAIGYSSVSPHGGLEIRDLKLLWESGQIFRTPLVSVHHFNHL